MEVLYWLWRLQEHALAMLHPINPVSVLVTVLSLGCLLRVRFCFVCLDMAWGRQVHLKCRVWLSFLISSISSDFLGKSIVVWRAAVEWFTLMLLCRVFLFLMGEGPGEWSYCWVADGRKGDIIGTIVLPHYSSWQAPTLFSSFLLTEFKVGGVGVRNISSQGSSKILPFWVNIVYLVAVPRN